MEKVTTRVSLVLFAMVLGCGSTPDGPYTGGSNASELVGTWKWTNTASSSSASSPETRYIAFSSDGRFRTNLIEGITMGGTYSADANRITTELQSGNKRLRIASTYAVSQTELALSIDDDVPVFLPVAAPSSANQLFRSEIEMTEFSSDGTDDQDSITVDLEIRPNGTYFALQTKTKARDSVARPPAYSGSEGYEWREVSPGRYAVKKTVSSTPKYYRLIGGRAIAPERSILTRS